MAFKIPLGVVNKGDLGKLLREIEALENYFIGSKISETQLSALPNLSLNLTKLLQINSIANLSDKLLTDLKVDLQNLKQTAPQVHISFASNPSAANVEKLLTWLRTEINPRTLVQVGLRPEIAAGCVINTGSRIFDFTIKNKLSQNFSFLAKSIQNSSRGEA
jgi:F0F1-type ATP synthase delta subunit